MRDNIYDKGYKFLLFGLVLLLSFNIVNAMQLCCIVANEVDFYPNLLDESFSFGKFCEQTQQECC